MIMDISAEECSDGVMRGVQNLAHGHCIESIDFIGILWVLSLRVSTTGELAFALSHPPMWRKVCVEVPCATEGPVALARPVRGHYPRHPQLAVQTPTELSAPWMCG